MKLSGQQRKQLHNALVDAFPDKSSIEQMLSYQLDKNLDAIAGGGNLEELVFNLIKTVESQGWIEELVCAACNENPGNPKLKAIAERLMTQTASLIGRRRAENALKRLGKSTNQFAKSLLLNPTVVTKFFQSQSIQLDSFKRICEALELNWQEVAEMPEEELAAMVVTNNLRTLEINEGMESVKTVSRQLTVLDKQSKKIKAVIVLEGTLDEINNDLSVSLELVLRTYSGDTIKITEIKEGSIKLFIEGFQEDIELLISRIQSGEIKELSGFPVKDIQILSDSSDNESTESDDKWSLVREIINQPVKGRNLSGADLSDADLSDANLSGTDLRGADLRGADLNFANLSDAILINANLSSAILNFANLNFADLSSADLSDAFLSGVNLSSAILISADLSDAILSDANLSNADLRDANLSSAILNGVNLSDAILSGVNLSDAILSGVNLSDAILSDANLINADLRDAKLRGADLSRAIVENALFGESEGLTKDMKRDLEQRGAIFGDRPPVFAPR